MGTAQFPSLRPLPAPCANRPPLVWPRSPSRGSSRSLLLSPQLRRPRLKRSRRRPRSGRFPRLSPSPKSPLKSAALSRRPNPIGRASLSSRTTAPASSFKTSVSNPGSATTSKSRAGPGKPQPCSCRGAISWRAARRARSASTRPRTPGRSRPRPIGSWPAKDWSPTPAARTRRRGLLRRLK